MRKRISGLFPVALGGFLLLGVACSEDATPQFPAGTEAPNAQATISALSQQVMSRAPTPTAVPASAMQATQDFAQGYQAIAASLDQLHEQFDNWQAGLNTCTQNAVQTDLLQFAGRFGAITQSARELTRASASRGLADRLIEAAEAENQALRQLRDHSRPADAASEQNPTGDSEPANGEGSTNGNGTDGIGDSENSSHVSLSEQVDAARSSSSAILREVTDVLTDQEERNSTAARESMDGFVLAFQAANTRWDLYHQEYDSFRSEEASLTSTGVVTRLSDLVAKFREVMVAVRELPRLEATQEVAGLMAEAADAEDLALRNLRATFQKSDEEEPSADVSDVLDPLSSVDELDSEPAPETGSFVADDPTLFSAYESQLVSSNTTRRQALDVMGRITQALSDEHTLGLAEFNQEYQALAGEWNTFHRDYDQWRRTEGGCDREKAVETLVGFSIEMGQIAASARNLPGANILRPLGELLVEAVQREETSLRELSGSWRPFDSGIYQQHHDERLAAGKLTRQVGVGIQDLLERYGIGPG